MKLRSAQEALKVVTGNSPEYDVFMLILSGELSNVRSLRGAWDGQRFTFTLSCGIPDWELNKLRQDLNESDWELVELTRVGRQELEETMWRLILKPSVGVKA